MTELNTPSRITKKSLEAATYVLGVLTSGLILYYAYSLFLVRDRQANLVLGLCLGLFYLLQAKASITGESAGYGDDSSESKSISDDELAPADRTFRQRLRAYLQLPKQGYTKLKEQVSDWVGSSIDNSGAYRRSIKIAWYLALSFGSLAAAAYIELNFTRISERAIIQGFTSMDYVVAALLIVFSIDVTRQAFGNILAGVIAIAVLYAPAGPYLPGLLYHSGMGLEQVLRVGVLSMNGVYGFILEVGATWIAVFLLLAGFAKAYGILDWVVDASQEIGKLTQSGIVHVAMVSSLVMGMITGSGAANTATTGSFTIPMLKKQGVQNPFAGALEAVSSIGGQLVPPIMGVAAFIMADLLGVPYLDIVRAGLLPAFLFYFSIAVGAQILIYKHGWDVTDPGSPNWSIFKDGFYYTIPFAVLIYFLVILQYTPLTAGLYTVVAMIGTFVVKRVIENPRVGVGDASKKTVEGLRQGAVDLAPIVAILASIGVAIQMFTRTGLAQRLSTAMIGLSGENLLLLLLLAMIVSLLFGMGMPAPAAYILTASLAATAMIQIGVRDITAHMFVFYFAMYSSLTPPVGPSTVIAANLAGANFISTAKRAMQLALPGFLIPFVFVVDDSLIYWVWPQTLFTLLAVMVGVIGISMATWASTGRNSMQPLKRLSYLVLSVVALFGSAIGPSTVPGIDGSVLWIGGCTILVIMIAYEYGGDIERIPSRWSQLL